MRRAPLPRTRVLGAGTALVACALVACGLPAARHVAIGGLRAPDDVPVTVDMRAAPPHLRACVGRRRTLARADFERECVIPYVNGLWTGRAGLLRPHAGLLSAASDWLLEKPDGPWPIYYPHGLAAARDDLEALRAAAPDADVVVRELPDPLPVPGTVAGAIYQGPGLLYLPNDYLVPGGIFQEMYGWDSFFIDVGLLASAEYVLANPTSRYWDVDAGRFVQLDAASARAHARRLLALAKGMVDNQAFEIAFYGGHVPNANRIYYLTRSQPPLFTRAALAVYEFARRHPEVGAYAGLETLARFLDVEPPRTWEEWLAREILPAARRYHAYWTDETAGGFGAVRNPRVAWVEGHRLTLYHPAGVGPAPEIAHSAVAGNRGLYREVAAFLAAHPAQNPGGRFWRPGVAADDGLTPAFYTSDRAVRASGYDLSGRYGDVGQWAAGYAPIALHALVYQEALDLATMARIAGESVAPAPALEDSRRAARELFWLPARGGVGGRWSDVWAGGGARATPYLYATTVYPLWADGLASASEAAGVVATLRTPRPITQRQVLRLSAGGAPEVVSADGAIRSCERTARGGRSWCTGPLRSEPAAPRALVADDGFGVPTSLRFTGNQWDYPNAWAPVQYFAAHGLRAHGYAAEARAVEEGWLRAVDLVFARTGTIVEKYVATDPLRSPAVTAGYSGTQVGFGWTNAVYLDAWLRRHRP